MIYLALYHGHRGGTGWRVWAARFTDGLTRVLTRGRYSHCEIAIRLPETADGQEYECYSASLRDGGVRLKTMPLPGNKWDLIDLSTDPLLAARLFTVWQLTRTKPYDLTGAFGVVFKFRENPQRWFCSEWCAEVLGLPDSWRFSPNDLAAILRRQR